MKVSSLWLKLITWKIAISYIIWKCEWQYKKAGAKYLKELLHSSRMQDKFGNDQEHGFADNLSFYHYLICLTLIKMKFWSSPEAGHTESTYVPSQDTSPPAHWTPPWPWGPLARGTFGDQLVPWIWISGVLSTWPSVRKIQYIVLLRLQRQSRAGLWPCF